MSSTGTAATALASAARAVATVLAGHSADEVLSQAEPAGKSALRAITLGTLRWYPQLDAFVEVLSARKPLAPTVRSLLACALHQLEFSRHPPEVIVFSAVDATRRLREARAAGLVNALLRRYLRERDAVRTKALLRPSAAYAHPMWLLSALRVAWPDHWQQIVAANNEHPPMTLRVDTSRQTRAQYRERLAAAGMAASAPDWSTTALVLAEPVGVEALPGFAQGAVSVQDAGAQLACALLGVQPGERVLDACAAPGGKTCALLEAVDGQLQLTAIDIDAGRCERINENLQRLKRTARVVTADLDAEPAWWDGQRFDRILLDAPCSATGVIRRHPDIKLLRRLEDIAVLAQTQQRLLRRCLRWLRPGGRLIYSTCSVLPQENEQVVRAVLAVEGGARAVDIDPSTLPPQCLPRDFGAQLLPGEAAQTDGFYYACLTVT